MPDPAAASAEDTVRFTNEQILRFCEAAGVTRNQIVRAQNNAAAGRFGDFYHALAYAHLAESPDVRQIKDGSRRHTAVNPASLELAGEWKTDETIGSIVRLGREQAKLGKPIQEESAPFTSWMKRVRGLVGAEPAPVLRT